MILSLPIRLHRKIKYDIGHFCSLKIRVISAGWFFFHRRSVGKTIVVNIIFFEVNRFRHVLRCCLSEKEYVC